MGQLVKQRGLSAVSLLIVLLVSALFLNCAIRILYNCISTLSPYIACGMPLSATLPKMFKLKHSEILTKKLLATATLWIAYLSIANNL